jgi:dTDP-glucose 4,6-dehydratase
MPHLAGEPWIKLFQGDIRSFSFPEEHFDSVVHAAASTSADAGGRPLELLSTLLNGTERIVGFARSHGTKRFLLISSGAVYGRQPQSLSHIPEDYLGGPDWLKQAAYGEGKRVSELMCSLHAQETNIEFTIARCFTFVGPHLPLDQHFAIGNFIGDALAGRPIKILGDGTPMRSYLYAADLSIWLWTMLLRAPRPDSNLQVYNVGSAEAVNIHTLARKVIETLNPSLKLEIGAQPNEGEPLLQYVPDVMRAETQLDLRQTIGLCEAIRRTAAWHREEIPV